MNISVIIPIHEFNDSVSELLKKAIESVATQKSVEKIPEIFIVYPTSIQDEKIVELKDEMLKKHENKIKINLINNEGESDYQSQVNLGVDKINTEYFSVLEFDDEYSLTYMRNVNKYIKSYDDIDIFLTMMVEVDGENNGLKYTNETVWAQQFVGENGEMGYLNSNSLKQYTDFKVSGAIIKKSEFENIGKYKSNIKLTFMLEFLLRALNNGLKIYSIPKIGYRHLVDREGSLSNIFLKTMPMNERKFWFETAQKEANFSTDREIDVTTLEK